MRHITGRARRVGGWLITTFRLASWLAAVFALCNGAGCSGGASRINSTPDGSDAARSDVGPSRWIAGARADKPVALPKAFPLTGQAPKLVQFSDFGSYDPDGGDIVKWEWNFADQYGGEGGWHDCTGSQGSAGHLFTVPGTYDAQLRVTDDEGDKDNGKITITITAEGNQLPLVGGSITPLYGDAPLPVSFNANGSLDPDGNIVRWEWDLLGNGVFADYSPTQGAGTYTYVGGGIYYPILRITDDNGAVATKVFEVYVNSLPVAKAAASPLSGPAPLLASFDGSDSSDGEGPLVKYEWDFGTGGGWQDFGTDPSASHTYASVGNYIALLRVTDSAGAHATASVAISVQDSSWSWDMGFQFNNSSWEGTSFAILANGRLCFAYSSYLNGYNFLRYASAQVDEPSGSGDWAMHEMMSVGMLPPSMQVVDGRPMLCSATYTGGDLWYARATTADPTSQGQWQWHLVDSAGVNHYDFSAPKLLKLDDRPVIIYSGSNPGIGLRMARAKVPEPTGSGDWEIVMIDPANQGPSPLSRPVDAMVLADRIVVGYAGLYDVRFAYSTSDPTASSDWQHYRVADVPGGTSGVCLDTLNGLPQLAWNTNGLYFARAEVPLPTASGDWISMLVTAAVPAGLPDLFVANGRCHLVFNTHNNRAEQMAKATSATPALGTDWSFSQFARAGQRCNNADAFVYHERPIVAMDVSSYQYWLYRGIPGG